MVVRKVEENVLLKSSSETLCESFLFGAISLETSSTFLFICTVLVPTKLKKKRVNEDETPLTLSYTKL